MKHNDYSYDLQPVYVFKVARANSYICHYSISAGLVEFDKQCHALVHYNSYKFCKMLCESLSELTGQTIIPVRVGVVRKYLHFIPSIYDVR